MVFIKTPSICNTNKTLDVRVKCLVNIHGHEFTLQAFLDSGATNSTIDEATLLSILPKNLIKTSSQPLISTQFDGQQLTSTQFVTNIHIKFYNNCGTYSTPQTLSKLWVKPLLHQNIHLILGLNFLISPDRAFLLTKDYALFFSNPIVAPIVSDYPSVVKPLTASTET